MSALMVVLILSVVVVMTNREQFDIDYLSTMSPADIKRLGKREKDDLYQMRYSQFYSLSPAQRQAVKDLMGFTDDPPMYY